MSKHKSLSKSPRINQAVDAFRYAIRSARSCGFFNPGNTILVPGMYCKRKQQSTIRSVVEKKQAPCTSKEQLDASIIAKTYPRLHKHKKLPAFGSEQVPDSRHGD
ncbi:unnamed protein product [Linum trigynum]|uniref:Uncharacterized protein n=1 Tax=Linum trigynum TaxID=586398 RepID=A0AAV2EH15_9ROSI